MLSITTSLIDFGISHKSSSEDLEVAGTDEEAASSKLTPNLSRLYLSTTHAIKVPIYRGWKEKKTETKRF